MPRIRLAVLNDYEIVVKGVRAMLKPFSERIRIVSLEEATADVAVDVTLYDTFGAAAPSAAHLDEVIADPRTGAVVVYAWHVNRDLVDQMLARGCAGYLDKSIGGAELAAAIEAIAAGERIVAGAPEETAAAGPDVAWPDGNAGLSAREAEVLALITRGLTNDEVAHHAHLSINSVKSYIRSAYRKIGVERRSQAVRWGMEHGMSPHGRGSADR